MPTRTTPSTSNTNRNRSPSHRRRDMGQPRSSSRQRVNSPYRSTRSSASSPQSASSNPPLSILKQSPTTNMDAGSVGSALSVRDQFDIAIPISYSRIYNRDLRASDDVSSITTDEYRKYGGICNYIAAYGFCSIGPTPTDDRHGNIYAAREARDDKNGGVDVAKENPFLFYCCGSTTTVARNAPVPRIHSPSSRQSREGTTASLFDETLEQGEHLPAGTDGAGTIDTGGVPSTRWRLWTRRIKDRRPAAAGQPQDEPPCEEKPEQRPVTPKRRERSPSRQRRRGGSPLRLSRGGRQSANSSPQDLPTGNVVETAEIVYVDGSPIQPGVVAVGGGGGGGAGRSISSGRSGSNGRSSQRWGGFTGKNNNNNEVSSNSVAVVSTLEVAAACKQ